MLQDEKLENIIYGGSEVIHSILNKYTGFEIPKNYSSKYPGHDLIKTTGMLVSNLPEAAGIGMLDINQIAVDFISHMYASQNLPVLIDLSANIVETHCNNIDY